MIGQDIAAGLGELQAQAESLMVDTCTVQAKPTEGAADPTTGIRTPTPGAVRYTGKCRVRWANNLADTDLRAEQTLKVGHYFITIPTAASAFSGDVVTVTASTDPLIPPGTFTVVEVVEGSTRIQRRLLCTRDT
jgi:hypothetical protein